MRKTLMFASLAAFVALSACNTVDGMAKDAKSAGAAVKNEAEKVGDKL